MADVFLKGDARAILNGRKVLFLGDSILRNLYQDLVYLLEKGSLTPHALLKKKGVQVEEGMFPGDSLVQGTGHLTTGRDYTEVREYRSTGREDVRLTFNFITRCYDRGLEKYLEDYRERHGDPDLILVLSALWDINRWGPRGIDDYKVNCKDLLGKVKSMFPESTQLVWLTSPPISVDVWGGLMVEGMEFLQHSMRFNVMEGNLMVALATAAQGFDVVDLHYWMTHQIHKRMPDGIHWTQDAVRLQLNIILTHFCLSRDIKLPNRWGGEQNRPLESAMRMAAAAVEVGGGEEVGPPRKRQRLERVDEKKTLEMEGRLKRRRELEEEEERPEKKERSESEVERHVTLVDEKSEELLGNQADSNSNLEDVLDVEVVVEIVLPSPGQGVVVEGRLVCDRRVSGRRVYVGTISMSEREGWEVVGGEVEVGPGRKVIIEVKSKEAGEVLEVGALLAQATL